jgi:hypothetical protein
MTEGVFSGQATNVWYTRGLSIPTNNWVFILIPRPVAAKISEFDLLPCRIYVLDMTVK